MYKPDPTLALEVVRRTAERLRRQESVSPESAVGRVLAKPLELPGWPSERLAWKDGLAVGVVEGQEQAQRVLTGQAVPEWALRVVPEERLAERSVAQWLSTAGGERPEIMASGREYLMGEPQVDPGRVVDWADASQWVFLDIRQVVVWAAPRVVVFVVGDQDARVGRGGKAAAIWLAGFLEEWGCEGVVVREISCRFEAGLDLEERDLAFLVSDGEPGRYGSLAPWWTGGVAGAETLFWKWSLLPCKHTGLATYRGKPVVVLPDLASKTMLSSLVLVPVLARAAWGMPEPLRSLMPAPEGLVVEPGATRLVPVTLRGEAGQEQAWALPVDKVFSGRDVAGAEGWYWSDKEIPKGSPVEIIRCRRQSPWRG